MSVLMQKRPGPASQAVTLTELPSAGLAELDRFLGENRGRAGMVIPALQLAQSLFSYVPFAAMARTAEALRVPLARVYGVATFYAQFRLQPAGRHTVRVCLGTACHVRGADSILRAWSEALGVSPGETTVDGAITLERVACLGACGLAPAAMIDEKTQGRLSAARVKQAAQRIDRG